MCYQSSTGQLVERQPSSKTSNTAERIAAADDWEDPKYHSDNFKIYEWKVTPCTYTDTHDTDKCPFAHPGEKAVRRDVRVYKYSPEACPATQQKNGKCPRGLDCPLSHTVFERWLHPRRFRTQMCTNGPDCPRKSSCFFAHSQEQLRSVEPDMVGSSSSSSASALSLAPSVERVSSINSNSSSASGSSTISGSSFMSSPRLLQQGSIASCFSISSRSSTPPSSSIGAAAAASTQNNSHQRRPSSSMLAGLGSPAAAPAAMHVVNKVISRPGAAARSHTPSFSSSSMGGNSSPSNSGAAGTSPVGGGRCGKTVAGSAVAAVLAARLKQQLEGQQELMRQQEQHLHEQQQLQQLQALMQQLPMPDGNSLGSPNSAQHMQLLLEQEISSNMQQAALAAAAAEAANQRLKALRCAMHPPGMLPAGAVGGYAPASAAGSAGLSSSISPIVHGGRLFNDPAVCQLLALGLDCYSYHHQQQQQNPPLHFSPASSMSLPGMEDPAGSPVLQPQAAAGAAYGHSNSTPPGLGFAGIDGGNNPQALLAMLLSQLQGSAAPGVVGGLHELTPACGANTHFQTNNPCASQETASALLAAAAAQMMPAAAGGPGAGLPSYTDASMGAAYAMQPQGGCHGFFMP